MTAPTAIVRAAARVAIVCAAALAGCATPRFGARLDRLGELAPGPPGAPAPLDESHRAAAIDAAESARVRVFIGTPPPGFRTREGRPEPLVAGASAVIGRVTTTEPVPFARHAYNDASRNRYCPAGRVLGWMFILAAGVGWAFWAPCYYGSSSDSVDDIAVRRLALIAALQRVALAAGADALLIDEFDGDPIDGGASRPAGASATMTSARGWALRLGDASEPPTAAPPTASSCSEITPTDRSPTDRSPTARSPTDRPPTDRSPTDRSPTARSPTDRPPTDRSPTDRSPTDRSPTDRPPTDRSPTDRSPTDRSPTDRSRTARSPTARWPAAPGP